MGLLLAVWELFLRMAPYLLLGFGLAGALHLLIPEETVYRHLSGRGIKSVLKAALFGVPLPLCSCSVIPVAAHIRQQGASRGATVSFLASTPTTGIDSIVATYGLLGPIFAVIRPISAFLIGLISGGLVDRFDDEPEPPVPTIECDSCVRPGGGSSIIGQLVEALRYGFFELVEKTAPYLAIGIIAGGLLSFLFSHFGWHPIGHNFWGYLMVMSFAVPLYVCSMGSIPVAAALIASGFSPGTAIVLLIAGPATNTATISFIGGKIGKKALIIYLATIVAVSLASAFLIDAIHSASPIASTAAMSHHNFEPGLIHLLAGMILGLLMLRPIFHRFIFRKRASTEVIPMGRIVLQVPDMSCEHCVRRIKAAVSALDGVEDVFVDLTKKLVSVEGDVPIEDVKTAIIGAGYTPKEVEV